MANCLKNSFLKMNAKKAKKLRRLARAFVIQTGKPISEIEKQYKKLKSVNKR